MVATARFRAFSDLVESDRALQILCFPRFSERLRAPRRSKNALELPIRLHRTTRSGLLNRPTPSFQRQQDVRRSCEKYPDSRSDHAPQQQTARHTGQERHNIALVAAPSTATTLPQAIATRSSAIKHQNIGCTSVIKRHARPPCTYIALAALLSHHKITRELTNCNGGYPATIEHLRRQRLTLCSFERWRLARRNESSIFVQ